MNQIYHVHLSEIQNCLGCEINRNNRKGFCVKYHKWVNIFKSQSGMNCMKFMRQSNLSENIINLFSRHLVSGNFYIMIFRYCHSAYNICSFSLNRLSIDLNMSVCFSEPVGHLCWLSAFIESHKMQKFYFKLHCTPCIGAFWKQSKIITSARPYLHAANQIKYWVGLSASWHYIAQIPISFPAQIKYTIQTMTWK